MDELVASRFDLIVTLADDAKEAVAERGLEAKAIEHWEVPDPTVLEGARENRLGAYRDLRDMLSKRIETRLQALVTGGSQIR